MAKTANGLKLIKTYYAVAPQIVQKVDSSANAGDYYNGICATICKRLELIKQNKLHQTIDEHKKMVLSLQNEFNIA